MTGFVPQVAASSCAASKSYGYPDEAVFASMRRTATEATCALNLPIAQLQRQHPSAFLSVAYASARCHLQLLQDPLWFATLGAAHACQRSSNRQAVCDAEVHLSAAAKEGSAVAAEITNAATALGQGDPVLRLQAAALLGEAATKLQSIGEKLSSSDSKPPETARNGSAEHSEDDAHHIAAAAERAASALQLWHFRLMALPFSLSVVTLGARGAAPWRPQPCSGLSGVAATPVLQNPFGVDEMLLLQQHIQLAISFINTLAIRIPHELEHHQICCVRALQQAQQVLLQLDSSAATAASDTTPEAAAVPDAAALCSDASLGSAVPPCTSPLLARQDRSAALPVFPPRATPAATSRTFGITTEMQRRQQEMLQSWLNPLVQPLNPRLWTLTLLGKRKGMREAALSRGLFLPTVSPYWRGEFVGCSTGAKGGSVVESSFLLKHAAKLHAFLTSSLRPELALR